MLFYNRQGTYAFFTLLTAYTLNLIGATVVIPVLTPVILEPQYGFFSPGVSETFRLAMISLLFVVYGVAQFFAALVLGAASDTFGRKGALLFTVGLSTLGYLLTALGVYLHSFSIVLISRIWLGACSGNLGIAQAGIADITPRENRAKALGYLTGVGGVGYLLGPAIGGLLALPDWLGGSLPFLFCGAITLLNLAAIAHFFHETNAQPGIAKGSTLGESLSELKLLYRMSPLRRYLSVYALLILAWRLFVFYLPAFYYFRFALSPQQIGLLFTYQEFFWIMSALMFNQLLLRLFPTRRAAILGSLLVGGAMLAFLLPAPFWSILVIIPLFTLGGACAYIETTALVSESAPDSYQGRALGAGASLSAFAYVTAGLLYAPAGSLLWLPMALTALLCWAAAALIPRRATA
ncbi:MAG: MFS transporter [Parachlamydiales bacterium]